jgi:hypothetical protein
MELHHFDKARLDSRQAAVHNFAPQREETP